MHSKLIVQFEMKWIMVIKFNIGVFVFAEKNSSDKARPS